MPVIVYILMCILFDLSFYMYIFTSVDVFTLTITRVTIFLHTAYSLCVLCVINKEADQSDITAYLH